MANRLRNIAKSRLKRDLIELEQERLLSISAKPLDNNIFEWHVNIKPTDGVYSGVYFHLIMTFPETYPTNPPKVKICTPISHPNVFSSGFICLSMLRSYTGNVPYEGWSGAYSVTSILMQLQSFLFAEKIDQDGGYRLKAKLSSSHIEHSIKICKAFKCNGSNGCGHSHSTPWPKIKGPREALIKIIPTDPESKHVVVSGSGCQTTHTSWVGARGDFGCNYGKVFYEAIINWSGDEKDGIDVALCRFGFGTKDASGVCDGESFGYDCSGIFTYNDEFKKFGKSFTKGDTITIAVDFDGKGIYCAKNGELQEATSIYYIPKYLEGKLLFPTLSFKNARVEFNFGEAKKPCKLLIDQGFKPLEQVAKEHQGNFDSKKEKDADDDDKKNDKDNELDWHSEYIIDELWLSIFESLGVSEVYGAQFVCKQWYKIINKYNIIDRQQICCYYTKAKIGQGEGKILGIGLNITTIARGHGFDIHSQMDILSLNAWMNGCRTGVWGEPLTHFLPLPMNKTHSEIAHNWIIEYLQKVSKVINTQSRYANNTKNNSDDYDPLQLVDTLVTMMNKIVVQFSTGKKLSESRNVSMVMCEKVVLGYCALHHLLLYLTSKHSEIIHNYANKKVSDFIYKPNGCNKEICKDLGKFLIYLLISPKYSWIDVADIFVKESFTRQVRWMVKEQRYKLYDTTKQISRRIENTFTATEISRRLIMFQVWFMQNNAGETLKGYNDRLGRPKISVKLGIVAKTKQILNSTRYYEFFDSLGCDLDDPIKEMDQLLRFAVWDSKQKGYHGSLYTNYGTRIEKVSPPQIIVDARDKGWKPAAEYIEILEKLQKDGLREDILNGIYDYGWRNLSGIHEEAIIPMMNGNDIITQTQYGQGGIGTFCISSLQCIDLDNPKCQTLILSPIRETAKQIFNIISSLAKYMKGLKCYLCVGGTSIRENIAALQKENKQIIIGTPGRVNCMISQGILKIDQLKLFILDGVDEMIAKGFTDQIYECFESLSQETQIALFSSTMTDKVLKLTEKFMKNPEKFLLKHNELSLDGIKQYYVAVEEEDYKLATLFDLYEKLTIRKAIIFVNSQRKLMWINNKMNQNNMKVSAISNEYSQKLKELEIKQFEQGSIKMLLLNDESLSLDIDIATVQLVINYDLPKNNESYIHRVGRSGRRRYAKKYVINFVTDAEEEKLREIEAFYDISINELPEDLSSIGIGIKGRVASDNESSNDNNNANDGDDRAVNNDNNNATAPQQPRLQPRTQQRMVTQSGSSNDNNDWRRATPKQQPQYINNYNRGRRPVYNNYNNNNNRIQERQIRPQTRIQRPTNNNYNNNNNTMQQQSRGVNNNNGGQQRSTRPSQRQNGMNNNSNNNGSRRGNNSNTNNRRREQIGNGDGLSKSQRRKMRRRNKNNC